MEQQARPAWTDGRLDDLAARVDAGFERTEGRFEQVDRRFEQVDRRFEQVERRLDDLRESVFRGNVAMLVGFISVLAAILARGA